MQREHVVAFHPRKRRIDEAVVADVAAEVLLDDDDGEDQLADRNTLVEAPPSPVPNSTRVLSDRGSPIQLPRSCRS